MDELGDPRGIRDEQLFRMLALLHLGERLGGHLIGKQAEHGLSLIRLQRLDHIGDVAGVELLQIARQAPGLRLEQLAHPVGAQLKSRFFAHRSHP